MRRTWHVFTSGAFTGAVGAFAGAVVGAFGGAPAPALAQTGTGRIVGTVTESTQNTPLANAGVGAVGGTIGARTGADGRYAINGVAPGRYVIRAQTIGYTAQTDTVQVAAGQTLTLNFSLRQVTTALQQVVVVGYGTQRRTDVTGSVASVTPNVERQPVTSVEQTLQGTAPGVQVTQASSAPGGGMSIRIRGGSSVNGSNEPLYVIDGFPVDNDVNASSPGDGGRGSTAPANPLAALNPNDIASIEILKDASATAIYGSRGANGVVLITTKRGQGNRPRVTLDTYTGVQNVAKRYELLDAQEYARFANTWAVTQNQNAPYTEQQIGQLGRGTDWQDLIFRAAPMYNVQLGVNGGGGSANQTRYALSGGVFNQQGVVQNSTSAPVAARGARPDDRLARAPREQRAPQPRQQQPGAHRRLAQRRRRRRGRGAPVLAAHAGLPRRRHVLADHHRLPQRAGGRRRAADQRAQPGGLGVRRAGRAVRHARAGQRRRARSRSSRGCASAPRWAATCRSAAATPTTRAPRSRARRSAVAPCGRASTTRASSTRTRSTTTGASATRTACRRSWATRARASTRCAATPRTATSSATSPATRASAPARRRAGRTSGRGARAGRSPRTSAA
jgi:TonB-dependent SusC/RagA subfamily outer membrane receptor